MDLGICQNCLHWSMEILITKKAAAVGAIICLTLSSLKTSCKDKDEISKVLLVPRSMHAIVEESGLDCCWRFRLAPTVREPHSGFSACNGVLAANASKAIQRNQGSSLRSVGSYFVPQSPLHRLADSSPADPCQVEDRHWNIAPGSYRIFRNFLRNQPQERGSAFCRKGAESCSPGSTWASSSPLGHSCLWSDKVVGGLYSMRIVDRSLNILASSWPSHSSSPPCRYD